jgi:membrane-associated phospholipid phosphatase
MNPFEGGMNSPVEQRVRERPETVPVEQPTRSARPGLVLALVLAILFAALTWFVAGPANGSRIDRLLNRNHNITDYAPVLHVLDRIGQRAVCLPILAVITAWVAWRHRSLRPVLISVCAVVAVNLLVLILKLWLGRGAPLEHRPAFFIDGQMYPSGHTSNIVAVYGTAAYLTTRYGAVGKTVRKVLFAVVAVLAVVMTVTSLLLHWHWFTDLIAGFLVGGMVLSTTKAFDQATPFASHRHQSTAEGPPAEQHSL